MENETTGHDGTDHLRAVLDHGGRVDQFVYDPEHGLAVDPAAVAALGVEPVAAPIAGPGGTGHDPQQLAKARGEQANVELVAVNDPFGDAETMAFLLKHDSVGRTLPNEIKHDAGGFSIDGREVKKLEVREPSEIPWGENGVDVVIESTGLFTSREKAGAHLSGGAKRVIISAPAGDADATICEATHRHLERIVHDELSRTARQSAQRLLRHRAGLHHHGARLHE